MVSSVPWSTHSPAASLFRLPAHKAQISHPQACVEYLLCPVCQVGIRRPLHHVPPLPQLCGASPGPPSPALPYLVHVPGPPLEGMAPCQLSEGVGWRVAMNTDFLNSEMHMFLFHFPN